MNRAQPLLITVYLRRETKVSISRIIIETTESFKVKVLKRVPARYFYITALSPNFPTIFSRPIDTIFARNSFLEWNSVCYRMRTDLCLTCCVLLHSQGNPICTVNALMAAYRRYEKREAPRGIYGASPRGIRSCFGKRGARESPLIARALLKTQ